MIHSILFPVLLLCALPRVALAADAPPTGCDECEYVHALVDTIPGTISEVVQGSFHEDITRRDRPGCMLIISGSWAELGDGPDPANLLFDVLTAEGWEPGIASGDSPDGTFFVLVKGDIILFVMGEWDGGDDSDSTYVPSEVYQIVVICTPLVDEDRRRLAEEERNQH